MVGYSHGAICGEGLSKMLKINTYVCESCAVGSLANIGTYMDPVAVFKDFCKHELGSGTRFAATPYLKLTNFYVFCAGPEVLREDPGGSHHSKAWVRYGTEFAQWLVDNKLGEVSTLGPKFNAKHHPKSTAQVWVWSPDQKAVEQWFDANK